MNRSIEIKPAESGVIRVFAINMAPAEVAGALKTLPKADLARQLLGSPHLNTASVEIFPVADLTGVGLSAYLRDGYAVDDEALTADRGKLEALEGYVLLLFSSSFAGAPAVLTPSADLTLIGSYTEPKPARRSVDLSTDSAKPYSGTPATQPATKRGPAGSVMVVLTIILVIGLAIWWVLA
ncbi:hypothetical protein ACOTTU_10745 [Roseobacter sp. EG26]|uniref:hypothetical protein n=1 Tax=Roseobacter sp. EG26 TaxID=3412477 RepID=UPI003CE48035